MATSNGFTIASSVSFTPSTILLYPPSNFEASPLTFKSPFIAASVRFADSSTRLLSDSMISCIDMPKTSWSDAISISTSRLPFDISRAIIARDLNSSAIPRKASPRIPVSSFDLISISISVCPNINSFDASTNFFIGFVMLFAKKFITIAATIKAINPTIIKSNNIALDSPSISSHSTIPITTQFKLSIVE